MRPSSRRSLIAAPPHGEGLGLRCGSAFSAGKVAGLLATIEYHGLGLDSVETYA
jgi:hypothetical protein